MKSIYDKLDDLDIVPNLYLRFIKSTARSRKRYAPSRIFLSDKKGKKLYYLTPDDKKVYFGNADYNDFFIYQILEHHHVVPEDYSLKQRERYIKRASKFKGDWREDKYSPNNLAMNILWQISL